VIFSGLTVSTDVDIENYHASDFISNSKLKTLADYGPMAYKARHLTQEHKSERSDAMAMGQAFEDYVQLASAAFAAKWQEAPAVEGKADDALIAEAAALGLTFSKRHDAKTVHLAMLKAQGVNVLSREVFVSIERMAESFARNAEAQATVRGLQTQVSLRLGFGGLDMLPGLQSRPDWYGTGVAPDLKTTSKFAGFDREIVSLGYHRQAALIDIIAGVHAHPLIVCESVWPYRCQVVDVPPALTDDGHRWVMAQLDVLRDCYTRDHWPLCAERRTASVPRYIAQREDW
jgi:hypothetical protein